MNAASSSETGKWVHTPLEDEWPGRHRSGEFERHIRYRADAVHTGIDLDVYRVTGRGHRKQRIEKETPVHRGSEPPPDHLGGILDKWF